MENMVKAKPRRIKLEELLAQYRGKKYCKINVVLTENFKPLLPNYIKDKGFIKELGPVWTTAYPGNYLITLTGEYDKVEIFKIAKIDDGVCKPVESINKYSNLNEFTDIINNIKKANEITAFEENEVVLLLLAKIKISLIDKFIQFVKKSIKEKSETLSQYIPQEMFIVSDADRFEKIKALKDEYAICQDTFIVGKTDFNIKIVYNINTNRGIVGYIYCKHE